MYIILEYKFMYIILEYKFLYIVFKKTISNRYP